jgi:hypothetical protein
MSDPNAVTPAKKQDTLGLILEGVNNIKQTLEKVERRTDGALNLAFRAHEKAKAAMWMRQSWGPYAVAALSLVAPRLPRHPFAQ